MADEIHKPTRVHFPTKKVSVDGIDDTWTADILFLPASHKEANDGYDSFLVALDVFSKYAWVKPIKNKTSDTVAKAFKEIFNESMRRPKKLWTDRGGEFIGLIDQTPGETGEFDCPNCGKSNKNKSGLTQHLSRFCPVLYPDKAKENTTKLKNIILYHTEGKNKATIAERFVKTIKGKMWKYMTENNTKKIIDVLDDLVSEYNNTEHSMIKMTPKEVSKKENEEKVFNTAYIVDGTKKDIEKEISKIDVKVNDRVRITRKKKEGAKGYEANWSDEIFKIREIKKTNPLTFLLSDAKDHHIKGPFYKQEIQKTKYDFDADDGYREPRTKENARIGKEAYLKEIVRQREKKQRAAARKKDQQEQQGEGLGLASKLPDKVLSNFDLEEVARDFPFWRGIFSRDQLPKKPNRRECGILNLDSMDGKGTHWVAWFKNKNTKYYFDSYGIQPPEEMHKYLKSPIFYNSLQIQEPGTYICGHLCIYVLEELNEGKDLLPVVLKLKELKEEGQI